MTIDQFRRLAAVAIPLSVLLTFAARADEPAKQAADPRIQTEAEVELQDARVRLAEEIDKTVELKGFLDVTSKLVASNALGIDVAAPDAALKSQLGLHEREGLIVTSVPDESLGAKAGLQVHDVLVKLDDSAVGDAADLVKLLDAADGKEVTIKVHRGGKSLELKATPKKPELATLRLKLLNAGFDDLKLVHAAHYRLGVQLSEADDTLRSQLGLAAGEGLVVTEVLEGTAAAEAGIRAHDVFTMLDGKRLATVETINAQIQEIKDKSVELKLLRGGKEVALRITPRKTQEAAFTDKPVTVWETNRCKECHQNPHQLADPHTLMGWKLGVGNSVWTDGHHAKLFWYEKAYRNQLGAAQKLADQPPAMEQIQSLKSQLAQMQKTLSALESSLQQPAAKEEEKKK